MLSNEVEFTDRELRTATATAKRVHKVARGLVEEADVLGSIYLWMWEKRDKIAEWRDDDTKSSGYLAQAMFRVGLGYVGAERLARTGAKREDITFYTPAMLKELLPAVWDWEDWLPGSGEGGARGPSRPAEGNNRLAMLSDVTFAVNGLSDADQEVLRDLYGRPNVSLEDVARLWETTESGARKKVDRVVVRLVDRLGGPPPWWPGGRRAMSNAQAQSEVER